MRRGAAYSLMVLVVLALVGLDYLILTSSATLSLLARRELDRIIGPALQYESLAASFDGSLTLASMGLDVTRRKLRVVSADRTSIRIVRKGGDYVPENITLHAPRITFNQDFFSEVAKEPARRPLRDLYPRDALPRILCEGGQVEIIHPQFFHWSTPQTFAIEDLALVPVTGYRYFVGGRLRSTLFGMWRLSGEVDLDTGATFLTFSGEGFRVGDDVRAVLAPTLHGDWDRYKPDGPVRARLVVAASPGEPTRFSATLNPEGIKLTYAGFPYAVEDLRGELDFFADGFVVKHLTARSGGTTLRFDGRAGGYEAEADLNFRIEIDSMPLDDKLRAALKPAARDIYDRFRPAGSVDIRGRILREYGVDKPVRNPLDCRFHGTTFRYLPFPYEMRDVEGEVHIDVPSVRVKHLTGRHGDAEFQFSGTLEDVDTRDPVIDLLVRANDLKLDAELKHAMAEREQKLWDRFLPSGTVDVLWHVTRRKHEEQEHRAQAVARSCRVTYKDIPLPVSEVTGQITFGPDEIRLHHMKGRLDPGEVTLNGILRRADGGWRHSYEIAAVGALVDDRFKRAMPQRIAELLETLKVSGLVNFDLHLDLNPDDSMYYRIRLELRRALIDIPIKFDEIEGVVDFYGSIEQGQQSGTGTLTFHNMRVMGKKVRDVTSSFYMIGRQVVFTTIRGAAYGGTINGYLRIDSETSELSGEFTADRLDLREFVRDTESYANRVLSGRMNLEIRDLTGRGNDAASLAGHGTLTITDGQLFEVPGIAKILSPFSGTQRFDAGKISFDIRNRKFRMSSFGFESDAGSVFGKGTVDFDGNYDVRVGVRLAPILGIRFFLFEIPGAIIGQFLRSRLQGHLESPDATSEEGVPGEGPAPPQEP